MISSHALIRELFDFAQAVSPCTFHQKRIDFKPFRPEKSSEPDPLGFLNQTNLGTYGY
jgi:hypothetical protein